MNPSNKHIKNRSQKTQAGSPLRADLLAQPFKLKNIAIALFIMLLMLSAQGISSEAVINDLLTKGDECHRWSNSGDARDNGTYFRCLAACRRYGNTVTTYPDQLNQASIQKCHDAHARAKQKSLSAELNTPALRTRDSQEVAIEKTTMSPMPDVEGIWTGHIKGRMRIRADQRQDWHKICEGLARVKEFTYDASESTDDRNKKRLLNEAFFKKIKAKDRVRLIGITYDQESIGRHGKRLHCLAEKIIIVK